MHQLLPYTGKFGWRKIGESLFAKIFLAKVQKYTENVFGICTDCSLFAKFFLANSLYLYGLPKFPLPEFSITVYMYIIDFQYQYIHTLKHCVL